ncbi:MAG: hypothetical protein ACD_73C00248G0001 [uncultured bacterium]|nr:MAG: hypothetical protein ACD_73C00248G0001 [uncultured bacterium]
MKKYFIVLCVILLIFSLQAIAQVMDMAGVYRSGNGPFKPGTKVKITRSGNGYDISPIGPGDPWSVSIASIRGAQAGSKGIWLYWFEGDNTLNAYIEIASGAQALVDGITKDVTDYNNAPVRESDDLKSRYDSYHEKAIKEAK